MKSDALGMPRTLTRRQFLGQSGSAALGLSAAGLSACSLKTPEVPQPFLERTPTLKTAGLE